MVIRFDKEKLSFITKKLHHDDMVEKWKHLTSESDLHKDQTITILSQNDLTNANNEIELEETIELKNFPPIVK